MSSRSCLLLKRCLIASLSSTSRRSCAPFPLQHLEGTPKEKGLLSILVLKAVDPSLGIKSLFKLRLLFQILNPQDVYMLLRSGLLFTHRR